LHEQLKQKERERYKRRKLAGKIVQVTNMSERDQRRLRKKWRVDKRSQRAKNNNNEVEENEETPPTTPDGLRTPEDAQQLHAHQLQAGRKKVRRINRQAYRTIDAQKNRISKLEKANKKLMRKLRQQENKSNDLAENRTDASPGTKANNILLTGEKEKIRKQLTFGYVISNELRTKLESSANQREKHAIY